MKQCCCLSFFDQGIVEHSKAFFDYAEDMSQELQLHLFVCPWAIDERQRRQTLIEQKLEQ